MTASPSSLGMRRRTVARGALINSAFLIGLGFLNLLKAVIAAAFLTQAEFGVWSILFLGVLLLLALKGVMVSDKYIQQNEANQEHAFQKSITLELISTGFMIVLALLVAPLLALIYDNPDLIAPTLVLALVLPGAAMQAPIWIFYRRMDFLRQRIYLAVDPVISFAVTIGLAIAGAGYWSLVIGAVAGSLTGGLVALYASPYPFRLRYDAETTRRYLSFSWPLVVSIGTALMIAHVSVFVGNAAVGLAASGAIGLAAIFSAWGDRVDSVITQAMYPAICRVADQRETLREAFEKSNRLALMWAVPFGTALTLFAADLIDYVLGAEWQSALILLQVFGVSAAISHIGFNWGAFYRAIGETRPIATVTVVSFVAFMAAPVPLIFINGLEGFALGMAVMTVVTALVRWYYVLRMFPGFPLVKYVIRVLSPSIPAAAVILALRALEAGGERTGILVVGELITYGVLTVAATVLVERALLREVLGYVRSGGNPAPGLA